MTSILPMVAAAALSYPPRHGTTIPQHYANTRRRSVRTPPTICTGCGGKIPGPRCIEISGKPVCDGCAAKDQT